jgi:thymidine kinase
MSKLYFNYGAMNSGKSTALLQVAHNYEQQGMKVLIIKPAIDTKAEDRVSSRLGIERKVDILLTKSGRIVNEMKDVPNAILVDEAEFLTRKQVDELYAITKEYDVPVLCYGLRTDFQSKGFEGATRLLELADDIKELKTICKCGSKATHNLRLVNNVPTFVGKQVEIDNQETVEYESVCGKCYLKLKKQYGKSIK